MRNETAKDAAESVEQDHDLGLERLIFFSDAVFAIAITLLALDIHLPELPPNPSDSEMLAAILDAGPKYFSFALSFAVVGLFWIGHHTIFQAIGRYDAPLMLINLLLLLFIAFIPFPTTLIGDYGNRVTMILYALLLACTSLLEVAIRSYSLRHTALLKAGVDLERIRLIRGNPFLLATLFVLSAIVAFFSTDLAWLVWWIILAISVAQVLLNARRTAV